MFLAKQSDGKSDGFEKLGEKEDQKKRRFGFKEQNDLVPSLLDLNRFPNFL